MFDPSPARDFDSRAAGEADTSAEGSSRARERLRELMAAAEADSSPAGPSAEEDERARHVPRWLRERLPRFLLGVLPDPGRAGCFGVVAVAVLGCVVFAITWSPGSRSTPVPSRALPTVERATSTTSPSEELVISVVGSVHEPGLVTLEAGARVADALRAAGGPLPGVETLALNLARELSDGEQLYVGVEPPDGAERDSGGDDSAESGALDLNGAEEQELRELPGVGPVTAGAILRWRAEHGSFDSVAQLSEVDGIGPATLSRLRDLVRV